MHSNWFVRKNEYRMMQAARPMVPVTHVVAIPACSSGLLVVALNRLGQREVNHVPDVRLSTRLRGMNSAPLNRGSTAPTNTAA
jgi:hypothetical protein